MDRRKRRKKGREGGRMYRRKRRKKGREGARNERTGKKERKEWKNLSLLDRSTGF